MDTPPTLTARALLGQAYDSHARSLAAYAVSLGLSRAAADDCLHSVFLDYYQILLRGADVRNPRGYLYQAVRHRALSEHRAGTRQFDASLRQAYLVARNMPDGALDEAAAEKLYRAVRQLPAEQREVIELKYFHQLTYQEIAELTDISANTAMSRGRLALERLATLLKEQP